MWPTLETHRLFLSLVECYKIVFVINKLNFDNIFEFTKCNLTHTNHPYKLYAKPRKCNPYEYSFPIQIVWDWNSLPGSIVGAGSLISFKSTLKCGPCNHKPKMAFLEHMKECEEIKSAHTCGLLTVTLEM